MVGLSWRDVGKKYAGDAEAENKLVAKVKKGGKGVWGQVCIGAGLMNFLNGLHLQGDGAKTLSGASIDSHEIQAAFCEDGERLLAWIVSGTPARTAHGKRMVDASRVLTDWATC
jgi:hypothetical protein